MAIKLQEIHPSLVHYPIALLPMSIGADLLARVTGSRRLATVGQVLMPVAAATAAVSAAAGLVAAVEVKAEGEAAALLTTHRNMNLSLTAVSAAMAVWRMREEEAGPGYLALGLAGLGALGYSAYLGGKMVYEHGMGVKPAGGLRDGDTVEGTPGHLGEAARRAAQDLEASIPPTIADIKAGNIAPAVGHSHENPTSSPPGGPAASGVNAPAPEGAGAPESIP